ncbi:response regulator, partial [Myxococcota bacterium]|nr:response regulator [Myxococcota bacterium]
DATQIHQVVMNLCTNACHAMRDGHGTLTVELTPFHASADQVPQLAPSTDPFICLQIQDTGHGMDEATLSHIFEPYFTTKSEGEGSGLGLATVHAIVTEHGGTITVSSSLQSGTTFRLLFPLHKEESHPLEDMGRSGEINQGTGIRAPNRGEHILLVDDEEPIVKMLQRFLLGQGYKVTARTCAIEAFQEFCANPDAFDLLISDLTMPRMTGFELAKKMLEIRPDFPITLCTGFSDVVEKTTALRAGVRDFIMKPIKLRALAERIRTVLDSPLSNDRRAE